jgi:hypothetical protein
MVAVVGRPSRRRVAVHRGCRARGVLIERVKRRTAATARADVNDCTCGLDHHDAEDRPGADSDTDGSAEQRAGFDTADERADDETARDEAARHEATGDDPGHVAARDDNAGNGSKSHVVLDAKAHGR